MDEHDDAQEDIYRDHFTRAISQMDADAIEPILAKLNDMKDSLVFVKVDHAKQYTESGWDAGSVVTDLCAGR